MNSVPFPFPLSIAAADTAVEPVSIQTAALLFLVVAVIYCVRVLSSLRARVADLEAARSTAADTPAPLALAPVAAPAPASQPTAALSAELLAVIAAAVHVALPLGRYRIAGIAPATHAAADHHAWSLEGRRQIFHSHNVR